VRIQTVEYRRLSTHDGYNNTTIGAVAAIVGDETPEDVLTNLREWVDNRFAMLLGDEQRHNDHQSEVSDLEVRVVMLRDDLARLQVRWDAARTFLEAHGLGGNVIDNLPF